MTAKRELDVDDLATVLEGLAHGVRLTIYEILREKNETVPLAELRKLVSERYMETDHRTIEFHVTKMQFCGILRLHQVEGKKAATLVKKITLPRVEDV